MRTVRLDHFLTDDQIKQAATIMREAGPGEAAMRVCEEVIKPNISEINEKLGQENDPRYLSFALEYVFRAYGAG